MFPNGNTLFIAKFNLYRCTDSGVFTITEDVSELIWAYDEESALGKLESKYQNDETDVFQVLSPIVRRIIT